MTEPSSIVSTYTTEFLGLDGLPIVCNPNCKKCYGRGYTELLEEKEFGRRLAASEKLKQDNKIPPNWEFGPYIQCRKCLVFFKTALQEEMLKPKEEGEK